MLPQELVHNIVRSSTAGWLQCLGYTRREKEWLWVAVLK